MSKLKTILEAFTNLCCYDYHYIIDSGIEVKLIIKKENLPHLLGLHKLVDIESLRKYSKNKIAAKVIYKDIKNGNLTYDKISQSEHFKKIEDRLNHIGNVESLLFDRIVLDFDNTKINTKIKSDILMYRKIKKDFVHLCLVKNSRGEYVPETLLVQQDKYYIRKQKELKVLKLIIKKNKKIIKEINYLDDLNINDIAIDKE